MKSLFWIITFIFGYKLGKSDSTIIMDKDGTVVSEKIGILNKNLTDTENDLRSRGVNIEAFREEGDGADYSNALRQAIIFALMENQADRSQNLSVHIPAGVFEIHANRIFSDFDFASLGLTTTTKKGIRFVGSGKQATILKLITKGTEKWFYDNQSINSQRFEHLSFSHMTFTTDNTSKGHGFKQWSQGGEKQFRFFDCELELGTIQQYEGTGNADLNRFLMCTIAAYEDAFVYNNNQSVANELITTDVSVRKGLIHVKSGGGGSYKHYGGNLEMHPHDTDKKDHFLLRFESGAMLGQANGDYNMSDVRFEIHGANKKLVKTYADSKLTNVTYTRCAFGTMNGGERVVVKITPNKKVKFLDCILHKDMLFQTTGDWQNSNGSPSNAQILFDGCDVGTSDAKNLYDRIITKGNAHRIIARDCFMQVGSLSLSPVVQDFDIGWKNLAPRGMAATKKIVPLKMDWKSFPFSDGTNEGVMTVPKGCYITKIYISKPALATSSSNYQLHIGNNEKTITLGSSVLASHNQQHVIELNEVGELAFTTVRLWATGSANVSQTRGIAYIEYI